MKFNKILVLVSALFLLMSCATKKQLTLFAGDNQCVDVIQRPQCLIAYGDILNITFATVGTEAAAPFNSVSTQYEVQEDGTILLPMMGCVKVENLTLPALRDSLTKLASTWIREPIVQASIANATITIIGEVNNPTTFQSAQPITLIQALGYAGDFTKNAKRDDVQVQREEQGKIHIYHVNMLSETIFSSPCYYLQKGDVVYVAPLYGK